MTTAGSFRRRSIAAVMLTALVASLLVAGGSPASAALYNPIPMNQYEEPTYDFTDADALFVYVTSDIRGGRVCVVPASVESTDTTCGAAGVAWASPNAILGIGSMIQPIEAPPLVAGQWRLLTETMDGSTGIALSEVFTVTPCPDCDRTIGEQAVAAWKARAEDARVGLALTCTAFEVKDGLDQVTAARGQLEKRMERRDSYTSSSGGFVAAVGAITGISFSLPTLEGSIMAGRDKALEILKDVSCGTSQMYKDIVDDPPDPAYDAIPEPAFRPIDPMDDPGLESLVTALDRQTAFGEASRIAFERYLGAVAAGDEEWEIAQAEAVAQLTWDLLSEIEASAEGLRQHASELSGIGGFDDPMLSEDGKALLAEAYRRVTDTGFTADEVQEMEDLGFTATQIDAVRTHFAVDITDFPTGTSLPSLMTDVAGELEAQVEGLRTFANTAAAAAARTRAFGGGDDGGGGGEDTPPTAGFEATPSSGEAPLEVTLTSTAVAGSSPISSTSWDLGDGSSATGATTTHTYTEPGVYTVTQTVSDGTLTDTATAIVTVLPASGGDGGGGGGDEEETPPMAGFDVTPWEAEVPVAVTVTSHAVAGSSPIESITWDFGDGGSGEGESARHTYTAPATYTITQTVVAGELTDTATREIVIHPPSTGVISNGTVQLGVRPEGHLNASSRTPSSGTGTIWMGLRYVPTNADFTSPGCLCEGWGVADASSGVVGTASVDNTPRVSNLTVEEFTTTPSTATSVVEVGETMRVTHDYTPSPATRNLYQVDVTIENISDSTVEPRYRRAMDWDMEPTAFREYVTIQGTEDAAFVRFASNNGFASLDPLSGPSDIGHVGDFVDRGPADHGALFDFGFDELPAGETVSFRTYYGAAGDEAGAEDALAAVGAEVYSLAKPDTERGLSHGEPNTAVFGFSGVGGESTFPADVSITGTGEPDPVLVGDELTYSLTVANGGPFTAGGVTVVNTLPAGVTFISSESSQGECTDEAGTVTCSLGPLAEGDTATIDIRVVPTAAGTLIDTATVSASGPDPDTSNNSVTITTGVTPVVGDDENPPDPSGICPPPEPYPVAEVPFADHLDTTHEAAIECVTQYGIARGHADGTYRPSNDISRAQMASLVADLLRTAGLELTGGDEDRFGDIGAVFERHRGNINVLAGTGIALGNGTGFDPASSITRAQMAALIADAVDLAHNGELDGSAWDGAELDGAGFPDVVGMEDERLRTSIQRLAAVGIVLGFGDGAYRPGDDVSRAQMASYLIRAAAYLDELDAWSPTRP